MAMWVVVEDFCDDGGHNHYENKILEIYQTHDEAIEHIADNIPKSPISFSGIIDLLVYRHETGTLVCRYKNRMQESQTFFAIVRRRIEHIDFIDPKKKLSGDSIVANYRLRSSDFI